jgi:hypothetical protein
MGLSREMEFQADEVAARLAGAAPLRSSLLRMPLADYSFNEVLNFYEGKVAEKSKSENLYKEQQEVMSLMAAVNNFPIRNNLPEISLAEQSKFAASRLVVTDQWASHPGAKERIERIAGLDIPAEQKTDGPANNLINNIEEVQRRLTDDLFKAFNYEGETRTLPFENFQEEYSGRFTDNAFPAVYNGYYDNKNPVIFDIKTIEQSAQDEELNFQDLFSDDKVNLVYTGIALKNDIESLKRIADRVFAIKTFDYDGIKYKQSESRELIPRLEKQLEQINESIKENDIKIFRLFRILSGSQHRSAAIETAYAGFFKFDEDFDVKYSIFTRLSDKLKFVNNNTPLDKITAGLSEIKSLEVKLKDEINVMLEKDSLYKPVITTGIRDSLELYVSKEWNYFDGVDYVNESLNKLYTAMNYYVYLLSRGYFLVKKEFLICQAAFLENIPHVG